MKVKFFTNRPHIFSYGGFDIQMNDTMYAIKELGINVSGIDYWSRDSDFDLAHFWGLTTNPANIFSAKNLGKKVVITLLLPYTDNYYKRIKRNIANFVLPERKEKTKMLNVADAVVVLNKGQYEIAHKIWGISEKKLFIIPNIVNENFFSQKENLIKKEYGITDYILVVGNICNRKNQLNLAKAVSNTNNKLLIIGPVLENEKRYGLELSEFISNNKNIKWIKGLSGGSDKLVAAYQHAKTFALPSYAETQPISALEALVCKKPLLLSNRSYAKQTFFEKAYLANPNSIPDMVKGIESINEKYLEYVNQDIENDYFTKKQVSNQYLNVYNKVLFNKKNEK